MRILANGALQLPIDSNSFLRESPELNNSALSRIIRAGWQTEMLSRVYSGRCCIVRYGRH